LGARKYGFSYRIVTYTSVGLSNARNLHTVGKLLLIRDKMQDVFASFMVLTVEIDHKTSFGPKYR